MPIVAGKTGLVNRKLPSLEGPKPILNLHPKILRACQVIYREAHPVLSGEYNPFRFPFRDSPIPNRRPSAPQPLFVIALPHFHVR